MAWRGTISRGAELRLPRLHSPQPTQSLGHREDYNMGKRRLRGLQDHFHSRRPPHPAACRLASPTPSQTLLPCLREQPPPARFAAGTQSTPNLRIPPPSAAGSFCGFAASLTPPSQLSEVELSPFPFPFLFLFPFPFPSPGPPSPSQPGNTTSAERTGSLSELYPRGCPGADAPR